MGAWALEFDPGLTGGVYEMVNFNGDLFAFCYSGTGSGVWRRTPPNWTRTFDFGFGGRACVWDGRMWAGGAGIPWYIYVSDDGVNWTVDHDFTCGGPYSHWSALGGYGDYLYAMQYAMCGDLQAFWRRTTGGVWTQYPPTTAIISGHSDDIIGYDDYVYWSYGSVRYYIGYWTLEPTIGNEAAVHFTVHNGILYAAGGQVEVWRRLSGGWSKELDVGIPWGTGAISIGDDGNLWLGCEDGGGNARVYVRQGGRWVLHSATAGVEFNSAIAHEDALYAGTNSCEFWVYTPDFAVSPVGNGLYNQAMDCDGDGDALYVCTYDGAGQPILVKAALPLAADAIGAAAFNPGAGDAINVRCGNLGGQLAVAGNFGANEAVETSDDGALTWTDIDRDAWGAETAQPLIINPNSLEEVMVALAGAQDITETFDAGATAWVVNNAAVGYSPGAMAKLPEGDELVVGDDAANTIEYSPNRGVELADITGVFAGNVAALEVV